MSECIRCGKVLEYDEIGLNRKLINKGAREFLCIDCLSKHFDVSASALRKKIEQYKEIGCSMFN